MPAYQRGKDIDVLFAYNDETQQYWELEEEWPDEPDNFPIRIDEWRWIKVHIEDIIENGFPEDDYAIICTKNGTMFHTYDFESVKDFNNAVRPFIEKHFAFIIYRDFAGYEYYWFNGWNGLLALQKYTNWFDMDIYYDWI